MLVTEEYILEKQCLVYIYWFSPVNFFLKVCGDNFTLVNIGNTLENSERNVLYTDLILFNYTKAILESSLRPDMTLPFP